MQQYNKKCIIFIKSREISKNRINFAKEHKTRVKPRNSVKLEENLTNYFIMEQYF